MIFKIDPDLCEYMKRKRRPNIVVDVATSNTSDFEVSEIFLRLASDAQADYLIGKKKFRPREAEGGRILLPQYRLEYSETVRFGLRKRWMFRSLFYEGIQL